MMDRLTPANVVDHRVAVRAGGLAFPTLAGLMSMCAGCHNRKTAAIDRPQRGGPGVAFKGCGADGYPIDPAHPAYSGRDTPSKDEPLANCNRPMPRKYTKFQRFR